MYSHSYKEWYEIQGILYSVTLSNVISHNYTPTVTRMWHRHSLFSYSDSPARLILPVDLILTSWFYYLFCRFTSVKFFYIILSMASGSVVLSHYLLDISSTCLPFFFFLNFAWGLSFDYIFKEPDFCFTNFSLLFSCFQLQWFLLFYSF